jgi:hypothetical protein
MKKVKFTLGLMLAMLFIGANVSYAVDYQKEDPTKDYKYASTTGGDLKMGDFTYSVGLHISPSPFFVNELTVGLIITDDKGNVLPLSGTSMKFTPSKDITKVELDGDGSGFPVDDMLAVINAGYGVSEFATVKLKFKEGNDNKVFLKRTIYLGMMAYNPETEQNEWIASGLAIQDLLDPVSVTDKTEFTDESGVASYTFQHNLLELYLKYPIYSISYELWVNNEINTPYDKNYGEGHGYPLTNKNLNIEAAAGITVSYNAWDYFVSGKDFSFEVTAEPGKALEFTTNSDAWNIANGGLKAVEKVEGSGVWTVTLTKITAKITIKIGYATEPESATGTGAYAADKVWGAGGTLYVQSANEGLLNVYSITGQLVKSVIVNGDYSITLPKGIYIIKLNNKAYKAAL